jgi:hypothetical protein
MLAVPAFTVVASPMLPDVLLIEATELLEELHVAFCVIF